MEQLEPTTNDTRDERPLTRREIVDIIREMLEEFERRLEESHYLESQR